MTPGGSELRWPSLARTELVETVLAGLRRTVPRSQLLRGPTGIGKTFIASHVSAALAGVGREPVTVVALAELRDVPLSALSPALSGHEDDGQGLAERAHALVNRLGSAPTKYVLVVDDAPLLDEVSASVIYQLVRVFGVPAILTARDEHRIGGPIARLLHEDLADVIEVGPLSREELTDLAEAFLAEPLRPESAQALFRATQGNALFLRETLVTAHRTGRITTGPHGAEIEAARLPDHLLDAVRDAFTGLSDGARRLAYALALSQPWPEALARSWSSSGLDELRRRSIVVVSAESGVEMVRVAHPFFIEFLLAELGSDEREELERAAAQALRSLGDDASRFAAAYLLVEHADADPAELSWAAGIALATGDMTAAARFARASRALGGGFDAVLFDAMAASALDEPTAGAAFDDADALAATDHQRVLVALRRGQHLAYRLRDPGAAAAQAAQVLASAQGADAVLGPEVVKWRMMAGELPAQAAEMSLDQSDPLAAVQMGLGGAMLATMAGDAESARIAIAAARPHLEATATAIPHAGALLDLSEFLTHVADGRIADAVAFAQERRVSGPADAAGVWSYTLALISLHGGHADKALRLARLAIRQLEWRDFTGLVGAATALAAAAAALAGEEAEAKRLIDSLDEAALRDIKTALHVAEARTVLAALDGDADGGVGQLDETVRLAVAQHHHLLGALAGSTGIRVGRAAAVADAVALAAHGSPSATVHAVAALADAVRVRDWASALDAVPAARESGMLAAARAVVVEASAQASDPRVRRRATLLAGELAALSAPDAFTRGGDRDALSAREWEIAAAAARRQRNREIADALGISPRTVENHLANIYRKLGVSGRDELAEALGISD